MYITYTFSPTNTIFVFRSIYIYTSIATVDGTVAPHVHTYIHTYTHKQEPTDGYNREPSGKYKRELVSRADEERHGGRSLSLFFRAPRAHIVVVCAPILHYTIPFPHVTSSYLLSLSRFFLSYTAAASRRRRASERQIVPI